jgi:hypothetical protein
VVGHTVGTGRSGRSCLARASLREDRSAPSSGRSGIVMPSPNHHLIVDAGVGTRKRAGVGVGKRTVVRDYLFRRETPVAKYFNRTSWSVCVTGGRHSALLVPVARVLWRLVSSPPPPRCTPGRFRPLHLRNGMGRAGRSMGRQWQECAHSSRSPTPRRTGQVDPYRAFRVGSANGRKARESRPGLQIEREAVVR